MRFLFLGAGAIGGYYGGRLAVAGSDVTFLVRERRKALLAETGLRIVSPRGDASTPVQAITRDEIAGPFDVVVVSCKAYDLDEAIAAIRPAVGANTFILPLLNGMAHLDKLDAAFGAERVLGGTAHISTTLDGDGTVRHLNTFDVLTQGPRQASQAAVCRRLDRELARGGFGLRYSSDIVGAMWEKWILISTLSGVTCLMRANIGEIVATDDGRAVICRLIEEGSQVARANGHPPRRAAIVITRGILTDPNSQMSGSLRRDLEAGGRIEGDHIVGDMVRRARAVSVEVPTLAIVNAHLQSYQNRATGGTKHAEQPGITRLGPVAAVFTILRGLR